jgi:hypothetical protein
MAIHPSQAFMIIQSIGVKNKKGKFSAFPSICTDSAVGSLTQLYILKNLCFMGGVVPEKSIFIHS